MVDKEYLAKIEARLLAIERRLGMNSDKPAAAAPPTPPKPEAKPPSIALWIQENLLTCIGIFMVILAGSWFIGYAFSHWIGEVERIFLSLFAGIVVYVAGLFLLKKQPKGGQALMILGEGVTLLSLFAGYHLYGMFAPYTAFALMFGVIAITTLIANFYLLESVASVSLVMALLLPFVMNIYFNIFFNVNYLLLISVASLFMLLSRGWSIQFYCAGAATFIYLFNLHPYNQPIAYLYIAFFYLLFFIPSALSACERKGIKFNGSLMLITSTLALACWIGAYSSEWRPVAYFLAALPSLYFSYWIAKTWDQIADKEQRVVSAVIFGFNVMFFTGLAIGSSSFPNNLGFILQGLLAVVAARFIFKAPAALLSLTCYFLIPAISLFADLPDSLYFPFYSINFLSLSLLLLALVITLFTLSKTEVPLTLSKQKNTVLAGLSVFTGLSAMLFIWNLCHYAISNDNIAHGVALVLYVIAAEVLIYLGHLKQVRGLRLGGIAMIVLVLGRLFLYEVWEMPIEIRTVTFVVTGVLLIGTAWFDKRSSKATL